MKAGDRFGFLTAIERTDQRSGNRAIWRWLCDCGAEVLKHSSNIRNCSTASCGCMTKTLASINRTTHGCSQRGAPGYSTFLAWQSMQWRCENPNRRDYPNYGGRGISVCDRWRSFDNFVGDMGFRPTSYHSIDRIKNSGNYEPGNCRWATAIEQANNKRTNHYVELYGRTQTISQWARETGIPKDTLRLRLKTWPADRALTTPVREMSGYGSR